MNVRKKAIFVVFFRKWSNCVRSRAQVAQTHTLNVRICIVNKHRNVADKLGWEPRRKYATAAFFYWISRFANE